MKIYYEQRYCDQCVRVHWLEVTHRQKQICHGETYSPHGDPTHYTRRLGHGIEVIEKKFSLPIDWHLPAMQAGMVLDLSACSQAEAKEPERETIDQAQDW
jgi:hypothetical protein